MANRFYSGQLVQIIKDLNAKIACRSIVGGIGKILQRRDYNGKECYDIEMDDCECWMYADHLQALSDFKFKFKKMKKIEYV